MYYLALLYGREDAPAAEPGSPEFDAEVERYATFEARAGAAIAGGAALYPSSEAVSVRPAGVGATVTDGPFTEQAEIIGGFTVFDCENLDEALTLAAACPAANDPEHGGAVELWPMAEWRTDEGRQSDWWLALLLEPYDAPAAPGTIEWERGVEEHYAFGQSVGSRLRGGGALFPPSSATTVRVRDGRTLLTDGPFAESAEVVNGLYMFAASDRASATAVAAQIPIGPKGGVELRQIVDLEA